MNYLKKPEKKKKRAKNNPRPTENDICIISGLPYAETHEIYGGNTRQLCIKCGAQVKITHVIHDAITRRTETPVYGKTGIEWDNYFKQGYQKDWERELLDTYIISKEDAREAFIKFIGKNYLED